MLELKNKQSGTQGLNTSTDAPRIIEELIRGGDVSFGQVLLVQTLNNKFGPFANKAVQDTMVFQQDLYNQVQRGKPRTVLLTGVSDRSFLSPLERAQAIKEALTSKLLGNKRPLGELHEMAKRCIHRFGPLAVYAYFNPKVSVGGVKTDLTKLQEFAANKRANIAVDAEGLVSSHSETFYDPNSPPVTLLKVRKDLLQNFCTIDHWATLPDCEKVAALPFVIAGPAHATPRALLEVLLNATKDREVREKIGERFTTQRAPFDEFSPRSFGPVDPGAGHDGISWELLPKITSMGLMTALITTEWHGPTQDRIIGMAKPHTFSPFQFGSLLSPKGQIHALDKILIDKGKWPKGVGHLYNFLRSNALTHQVRNEIDKRFNAAKVNRGGFPFSELA